MHTLGEGVEMHKTLKLNKFWVLNGNNHNKGFVFEFSHKTAIIGENSSGKSLIMSAIAAALGSRKNREIILGKIREKGDNPVFYLEVEFNGNKIIFKFTATVFGKENFKYEIYNLTTKEYLFDNSSNVISKYLRNKFDFPLHVTWDTAREASSNDFVSVFFATYSESKEGYMFSGSDPENSKYTRYITQLMWLTGVNDEFIKEANKRMDLGIKINERYFLNKNIEVLKELQLTTNNETDYDVFIDKQSEKLELLRVKRKSILIELSELKGSATAFDKTFFDTIEGKMFSSFLTTENVLTEEKIDELTSNFLAYKINKGEERDVIQTKINSLKSELDLIDETLGALKEAIKDEDGIIMHKAIALLSKRAKEIVKVDDDSIDNYRDEWNDKYNELKNIFKVNSDFLKTNFPTFNVSWKTDSILINKTGGNANALMELILHKLNLLHLLKEKYGTILPAVLDGVYSEEFSENAHIEDEITRSLMLSNVQTIWATVDNVDFSQISNGKNIVLTSSEDVLLTDLVINNYELVKYLFNEIKECR